MDKIFDKSFIKNIFYAFGAQTVSLLSSFFVSFLVPKVLGINEFGFWQLFLFYVSYINISRLGLIDGMYLKLGGKTKNELNIDVIKTEFFIFFVFQIIIALCIIGISNVFINDSDRLFVLLWCSICLVIINCNNYFGFLFQAINMTKVYSISEIIYNLLWFVAVIIVCSFNYESYKVIIIFYTIGQILAGIYLLYNSRFIFRAKMVNLKIALHDAWDNIKSGSSLLIAFYASMLIVGSARFIIDSKWGIAIFGVFSFSLSLSTFILKFISQLSMVLFPALRRLGDEEQISLYESANILFSVVLPAFLLLFLPLKIAINWWLPQYSNSLFFLGILLPICIYDGKMQLLYSTYMKVLRKEKQLLFVNVIAMIACLMLSYLSAFVFNDLNGVAISIIISVAIRSILSEIILSLNMNFKINLKLFISENLIIVIFIGFNFLFDTITSFTLYLSFYCIFVFFNRRNIKNIILNVKKKKNNVFDLK